MRAAGRWGDAVQTADFENVISDVESSSLSSHYTSFPSSTWEGKLVEAKVRSDLTMFCVSGQPG